MEKECSSCHQQLKKDKFTAKGWRAKDARVCKTCAKEEDAKAAEQREKEEVEEAARRKQAAEAQRAKREKEEAERREVAARALEEEKKRHAESLAQIEQEKQERKRAREQAEAEKARVKEERDARRRQSKLEQEQAQAELAAKQAQAERLRNAKIKELEEMRTAEKRRKEEIARMEEAKRLNEEEQRQIEQVAELLRKEMAQGILASAQSAKADGRSRVAPSINRDSRALVGTTTTTTTTSPAAQAAGAAGARTVVAMVAPPVAVPQDVVLWEEVNLFADETKVLEVVPLQPRAASAAFAEDTKLVNLDKPMGEVLDMCMARGAIKPEDCRDYKVKFHDYGVDSAQDFLDLGDEVKDISGFKGFHRSKLLAVINEMAAVARVPDAGLTVYMSGLLGTGISAQVVEGHSLRGRVAVKVRIIWLYLLLGHDLFVVWKGID
jgi:hypothetical protein